MQLALRENSERDVRKDEKCSVYFRKEVILARPRSKFTAPRDNSSVLGVHRKTNWPRGQLQTLSQSVSGSWGLYPF